MQKALVLAIALLAMAALTEAAPKKALVVFSNTGIVSMGVYFVDPTTFHERFLGMVKPGADGTWKGSMGDSFVVRSVDMEFRTRLNILANDDTNAQDFPYKLTFTNFGDKSVELKHGDAGYLWIESNSDVSQVTYPGHHFDISEKSGSKTNKIVRFRVEPPKDEL
mmetsp:Transcript_42386/g.103864  ORF Transcript_42386/g.103864 Transcript_42386/m.103864 type:complete len:165 (-) Transcript_42386:115-609(-)